ncbi:MAG: hypothetical protein RR034_06825 [Bacteroidales bacterium]
MEKINMLIDKIIDNLILIQNNGKDGSQIEKDVLLQYLREAYVEVLKMKNEDREGYKVAISHPESQKYEEALEQQETEIPDSEMIESPVEKWQEPSISEEECLEEEEKQTEIKTVPIAMVEEESLEMDNLVSEIMANMEQEVDEAENETMEEEALETMIEQIIPEPVEEEAFVANQQLIASEYQPSVQEQYRKPDEAFEPESMPEREMENDEDFLQFIPQQSHPVKEKETAPVELKTLQPAGESKKEVKPPIRESEPSFEKNQTRSANQTQNLLFPNESILEPVKPAKRSLNDLLNEHKEDHSLGLKFQQARIQDLSKAISLNDKFLFIRELFKNKGEEFSQAIMTLNSCETIEEAFDVMEVMKKHYFWDSTSSAYLALCDLVRRKFV